MQLDVQANLALADILGKAYKLAGKTEFQGLSISIETKKGQTRKGIGTDGKPWSITMPSDYGYILGTKGKDGQHVDCFIGPNKDSDTVYIVHQHKEDSNVYDEDKCMLGFDSKEEAVKTYKAAYNIDILQSVDSVPFDKFVEKIFDPKNKGKKIKIGRETCRERV